MDIGGWLRSFGLGKYEAVFRENDLDETVLPSLTSTAIAEAEDAQRSASGHSQKRSYEPRAPLVRLGQVLASA
jgi:hypothetical protein